LVQKIIHIYKNDNLQNIGERCLKEGENFTIEIMKKKYLDLYENILYREKPRDF
jgi:glycosyltransferase involved in cell wall biosynthesis